MHLISYPVFTGSCTKAFPSLGLSSVGQSQTRSTSHHRGPIELPRRRRSLKPLRSRGGGSSPPARPSGGDEGRGEARLQAEPRRAGRRRRRAAAGWADQRCQVDRGEPARRSPEPPRRQPPQPEPPQDSTPRAPAAAAEPGDRELPAPAAEAAPPQPAPRLDVA